MKKKIRLGVNIDHVATLRQARKIVDYPRPDIAAVIAEEAGADSIVAHLRKDRRHIKEKDLLLIKQSIKVPLNLEMSTDREIVSIVCKLQPYKATLVPERREEITTEGGLDIVRYQNKISQVVARLKREGIRISLFLDPEIKQIRLAKKLEVEEIEIHTGRYANARTSSQIKRERERIERVAKFAHAQGFSVAAGHGLNYHNVKEIAEVSFIEELNIGHSIISQAIFIGLKEAVRLMLKLISP
ncbi:MAG: pyridoxine 5'-phosphate synthase [Candidatus Omnitrophica bacterium]|nr:pyridoxine 5'-phosphate synthase [Candidatus Omnitrophota bacterium]